MSAPDPRAPERDDELHPERYTDHREPGFFNAVFKGSWMFFTVFIIGIVALAVILFMVL